MCRQVSPWGSDDSLRAGLHKGSLLLFFIAVYSRLAEERTSRIPVSTLLLTVLS